MRPPSLGHHILFIPHMKIEEDWIRTVQGLINTWCVYVPPIDTFQPFVLV